MPSYESNFVRGQGESVLCWLLALLAHLGQSLPCVIRRQFKSNFKSFGILLLRCRYAFSLSAFMGTQPIAFVIRNTYSTLVTQLLINSKMQKKWKFGQKIYSRECPLGNHLGEDGTLEHMLPAIIGSSNSHHIQGQPKLHKHG